MSQEQTLVPVECTDSCIRQLSFYEYPEGYEGQRFDNYGRPVRTTIPTRTVSFAPGINFVSVSDLKSSGVVCSEGINSQAAKYLAIRQLPTDVEIAKPLIARSLNRKALHYWLHEKDPPSDIAIILEERLRAKIQRTPGDD